MTVTLVPLVDRGAMAFVENTKCDKQLLLSWLLSGRVHDRTAEDTVTLDISRPVGWDGGSVEH